MTKIFLLMALISSGAAAQSMKFNYKNEEITKIVEDYAKATKQVFVFEGGVRGKATILTEGSIPVSEAYNLMSSALAVNGYGITKQGETFVIMSARNIQRNLVEVTTEVPALKPERMVTYIYSAKNIPVTVLNSNLRILSSKDGEMTIEGKTNRMIFTDWSSNIQRIATILKEVDKPADPNATKFSKENFEESEKWRQRDRHRMVEPRHSELPPPPKTNQ